MCLFGTWIIVDVMIVDELLDKVGLLVVGFVVGDSWLVIICIGLLIYLMYVV